jgi:acetylornithine/N-succinyldiaminopimelate aminotransferase
VVLDTVANPAFLAEISRKGEKIRNILASWKHTKITEIRGKGMLIGMDITNEAWPVLEAAVATKPGLLLLSAGKQTLRLLPPYIISDAEIEQGLDILKSIL